MLFSVSVIPIGAGSSLGDQLAKVLNIIDESGLPYKTNPMGTAIEGEWDEVMELIKKCHQSVMASNERAYLIINVDDRKSKPNRLEGKVKSVEERLGRELKK